MSYPALDKTVFEKAAIINQFINVALATIKNWFFIVNLTEEAFIANSKETVAFPTI